MIAMVAAALLAVSVSYDLVPVPLDYALIAPAGSVTVTVEAHVAPVSPPGLPAPSASQATARACPNCPLASPIAEAVAQADEAAAPPLPQPPAKAQSPCPNGQCPNPSYYTPRLRRR